jgi:spore coat polysaccharide biosynthesis predicted glycosyltransferase SpsG
VNLTIITDGNKEFGLGHIKRSKTLAKFLIKDGHKVNLIVLSEGNIKGLYISNDVIIDIPYDGDFLIEKINSKSKVVGLDYVGESNLDLVVNIFDFKRYKGTDQINGLEFAIIREDVIDLIEKNRVKKDKVLVMLGSYDLKRYTNDVIHFSDSNRIPISIIEKENSIDTSEFQYCNSYENPTDIAKIMNESLWAITNGGSTMLELMALGVAIHVLPQTKAEMALARKIFNENALLGVGFPISIPDITKISVIENNAKKLIDGFGVNRVVQVIKGVFND